MRTKTTRVICNSQDPESRPAVQLSPLAIEDLTDEPQFALTAPGRAEIADAEYIPLTPFLKALIEEFRAARLQREQARGDAFKAASEAEDKAALKLAWALDQESA